MGPLSTLCGVESSGVTMDQAEIDEWEGHKRYPGVRRWREPMLRPPRASKGPRKRLIFRCDEYEGVAIFQKQAGIWTAVDTPPLLNWMRNLLPADIERLTARIPGAAWKWEEA